MHHEYHIITRIIRWLRRITHRRGYGVHSPLAFNFITGVIYNDTPYYAYTTLRQHLTPSIARLDEYDPLSGLTDRDLRLIFRLTNYQEPTHIYIISARDTSTLQDYIRAARRSANIITAADTAHSDLPHDHTTADTARRPLYYIDSTDHLTSLPTALEGAMIIVRGIHADPQARAHWAHTQAAPGVTLTFDLGRFGIILNRPKINRQDYIVNFF